MAVKNIAASVLAKLRNQAKQEGINYQIGLQLFIQEEFLRRLSKSAYKENLVLKGGMFIYTLTEFESRPTKDMDFLMQSISNDIENVKRIMSEICLTETENDFVSIEVLSTSQITLEKQYPGVSTKLIGRIGNVRVPFSIDIGIDDVIVPKADIRKITTRLDGFSEPEIYTYSLESTIAEKFDAIIQRMETTSRMKDFYDIYYLSKMFDFDGAILKTAIFKTAEHRGRQIEANVFDRISGFGKNTFLLAQWKVFEPAKETEVPFDTVIGDIIAFLKPCIISEKEFSGKWICKEQKWNI